MVRHIVAWNYKAGFSEAENRENAQKIKSELENLTRLIGGIVELTVQTQPLASSGRAITLNSLFLNEQALQAYQAHPEHKRVGVFVSAVTQERICLDYYE